MIRAVSDDAKGCERKGLAKEGPEIGDGVWKPEKKSERRIEGGRREESFQLGSISFSFSQGRMGARIS